MVFWLGCQATQLTASSLRFSTNSCRPLDSAAELPALRRVVERDAAVVGADGYCFLVRMPGHAIDGVVAALQDA